MRPHLQMDYYMRATRRSSSTTLTTIVKESPGIETFSYVSSNVTIICDYRAGGWVENISIDHSSNKSEMSRGGRQPLLIFKKYSWGCIWEIQLRNTVEKYGAPQLLITVSIGRRKTLWGARYLFAARPHTGEYSEYQIQLYIFFWYIEIFFQIAWGCTGEGECGLAHFDNNLRSETCSYSSPPHHPQ